MKKYIILSLFTVSSACIYTMENKSFFFDSFSIALCFSSFFGWFSSPKESLLISNLRKDVNNFKKKHLDEYEDVYLFGYPNDCIVSHASEGRLVKCCYFYKYKKKELKNLNDLSLNKNQTILNKCLNENIKGYSALGAAIIARDTSFEKRRILVQYFGHFLKK